MEIRGLVGRAGQNPSRLRRERVDLPNSGCAPPAAEREWHGPLLSMPLVPEATPASLPAELERGQARRIPWPAMPGLCWAPVPLAGALHHSVRACPFRTVP